MAGEEENNDDGRKEQLIMIAPDPGVSPAW